MPDFCENKMRVYFSEQALVEEMGALDPKYLNSPFIIDLPLINYDTVMLL